MGRTPLRGKVFYQPAYFCRGGYLIRPAEELHKSALSFGKKGPLLCFVGCGLPGQGTVFPLAQLGPQPSRWRPCRLTDGTYPPAGKTTFSFAGERGVFTLQLVLPAQQGPKPLFLLSAKEKAVLDSEKEKVDRWK